MLKYVLTTVGFMALATSASAQDVTAAGGGEESAADAQTGIGDIVVTASRRSESVQRAALSIQAISSDAIARANIAKPEDLAAIAPGVQIGSAGAYAQAYIRGVGNFATNAFAESSVAFNLDGVYISRSWAIRGSFFDLDRVEVLKGPQGTLYGRNASGGAVNIITAKPKLDELGGFAEFQAGNFNLLQGTAALNVPLGDTLALRASGMVISRDGYLSDDYSDDETQAGRLQLLWKPNSDVSLLVSGQYQHIGGNGEGSTLQPQLPGDKWRGQTDPAVVELITGSLPLGPLLTFPKTDGYLDIDVYSLTAELNWYLGFATLTVLPAYREANQRSLHYNAGFPTQAAENNKQKSVEVRLGNDGDKLKWVLGAFYFDEITKNLPGQSDLLVNQGFSTQDTHNLNLNTRSYAAFGQATFSVTDSFRLTGGLRYTYERKRNDELLFSYGLPDPNTSACAPAAPGYANTFVPTAPFPPQFCRLDTVVNGQTVPGVSINNRQTYNSVTWKAGVEYDLAPQSMAYASVSTGFKSGGVYTAPPPNTFRPEKLTSYEVGVKNRFLDNRLQVNLEAFLWKYKDHQESFIGPTSIPGLFTFVTQNAGKATLYGADLDVVFKPTQADEFSFKIEYNKTKYDEFSFDWLQAVFGPPVTGCGVGPSQNGTDFVTIDCSGKSLIRAPLWSGTVGYNHTFDLGEHGTLNASADLQFASGTDLSIEFVDADRQEAYAIGNFDLTYTSGNGKWVVAAFVHNIWDEAVYNQTFHYPFAAPTAANPDGLFFGTVRPPRTFGAKVRVNF